MAITWVATRARVARQRAQGKKQRERIAELVSEGWSVQAAAREIGISQQMGSKHWRKIKEELGPQAV